MTPEYTYIAVRAVTNAEMLKLESTSTDRSIRFTINYARCQYGARIGRQIAGLILAGYSVTTTRGDGFFVDGRYAKVLCSGQRAHELIFCTE